MGWKGTLRSLSVMQRQSEREALKKQRELDKQRKLFEKMQELERSSYEVQVYENDIDVLISIHKDCGENWNWKLLQAIDPPIKPTKSNANERLAQSNLEAYKPSLIDKILKRIEIKRNELIVVVEENKRKDEQAYQEALEEYEKIYSEWKAIRELAIRILSGDIAAFTDAILQADPFSEINQIGSAINFEVNEDYLVEAILHVNSQDVIPNETKTLLKSGKLSVKKMTKTKFYELYQDYVCGAVLRVARELFALLPVNMVIVTAQGELLNTKTGHLEEQPIVSVAIPKETLNRLNFDMLDPSDSMDNFLHKMKFLKTKGFQKVDKILVSALNSSQQ